MIELNITPEVRESARRRVARYRSRRGKLPNGGSYNKAVHGFCAESLVNDYYNCTPAPAETLGYDNTTRGLHWDVKTYSTNSTAIEHLGTDLECAVYEYQLNSNNADAFYFTFYDSDAAKIYLAGAKLREDIIDCADYQPAGSFRGRLPCPMAAYFLKISQLDELETLGENENA